MSNRLELRYEFVCKLQPQHACVYLNSTNKPTSQDFDDVRFAGAVWRSGVRRSPFVTACLIDRRLTVAV